MREFFRRLRIGLALMAGYVLGSWLRAGADHYPSELFVLGFGGGVILTQAAFWFRDRLARRLPD